MKLITGCWFEFRHHSAAEGLHYNPSLHDFTGDQWRAMISDMAELGMDTAVEHVRDFEKIAAYGVMTTPALVVDGRVVSYGKVLKKDEVVKILKENRR